MSEMTCLRAMRRRSAFGGAVLAVVTVLWLAGCTGGSSTPAGGGSKAAAEHDHDHEHAQHGPHGGHLMEIGEEEYHAEWTHDESGKVTFYILGPEAKKEVPVAAAEITIDVKVGDHAPQQFQLAAVNPQDGKSAVFETVNQQLVGVLETLKSESVVATLHVPINGKTYDQRIQEHEHGHEH
jgi:hypothetical protein